MRERCRARLDEYERLLFTPEPERLVRDAVLDGWLDAVAENMYGCERRSRGRDLDKIRASVECMAIEVALAQRLGVPYDLKADIDPALPSSFYYDLEYEGDKLETKIHQFKWFSLPSSSMRTFKKHAREIDFLVSAQLTIEESGWYVGFKLVAHAPSFGDFCQIDKWNSEREWYDHLAAGRDMCRYNGIEYFTEAQLMDSKAAYKGWKLS